MNVNDQVKSAGRVLDILEIMSTSESLTLDQVTRRIDAPKSSTLMLLRTLTGRSYLERVAGEGYRLNPALVGAESGWIGGHLAALVGRAEPVMRRLSGTLRETCLLACLTPDRQVRLLAKIVSPRAVRYDTDLAGLHPAHLTASGRTQLAQSDEAEVAAYVSRWRRTRRPEAEHLDEASLRRDLAQVRDAGVAVTMDRWEAGATGVSAPIFGPHGRVVAALTVGVVTARFLADGDDIVTRTREAAFEITRLQAERSHLATGMGAPLDGASI